MKVKFKFLQREDIAGKTCTFNMTGLMVTETSIDFEDIDLSIGGAPYRGFSSFAKERVPVLEVFDGVLNAYLREDTKDFEFLEGWDVFDPLKKQARKEAGLLKRFIQIRNAEAAANILILALPGRRYYIPEDYLMDEPLLLNEGGEILTDYEFLFENSLVDDLDEIRGGTEKPLFMSSFIRDELNAVAV